MTGTRFDPGAIFCIPLLRGGYAFGYITAHTPRQIMWALANIFEPIASKPTMPPDLEHSPIALADLLITRLTTFDLPDETIRWTWTGTKVSFSPKPVSPFVRMGDMPPMRIDLTGTETDQPIPRAETSHYPPLRIGGGPGPTATAEVALRKLALTPRDLISEFLEKRSVSGGSRKLENAANAAGSAKRAARRQKSRR